MPSYDAKPLIQRANDLADALDEMISHVDALGREHEVPVEADVLMLRGLHHSALGIRQVLEARCLSSGHEDSNLCEI